MPKSLPQGTRVLDFGCGLGRLAFAFANDLSAKVTWVDQSTHHLRIAEQEWKNRRTHGEIEFITSSPDLLASVGAERFDFFHSVLVLQHMVQHYKLFISNSFAMCLLRMG